VIATTTAYQRGADPPIDYEHQTPHSQTNGKPAPASGWIRGLEARPDGTVTRLVCGALTNTPISN